MYRGIGIIIVLLLVTSCTNHTSIKAKENFIFKWMNPKIKKNICHAYGGRLSSRGDCVAGWESAKDICDSLGGMLPSQTLLTKEIVNCGGVINQNNQSNDTYQQCYHKEGFNSGRSYWSSTKEEDEVWTTNFYSGGTGLSSRKKNLVGNVLSTDILGRVTSVNMLSNAKLFRCVRKIKE